MSRKSATYCAAWIRRFDDHRRPWISRINNDHMVIFVLFWLDHSHKARYGYNLRLGWSEASIRPQIGIRRRRYISHSGDGTDGVSAYQAGITIGGCFDRPSLLAA